MKKVLIGLLLSTVLMGVLTTTAFAEDKNASSEASVSFTGNSTDPTSPKNPDAPDQTGTEPGTGMNGPLSLDYVPTLDYGTNEISGSVEVFDTNNLKPYIQVTDKRGTGVGWNVSVSLSAFTGNSSSFDSAALVFTNPSYVTTTGNGSGAPSANSSVVVESGQGDVRLVGTTAANQGMGTWLVRWYPADSTATSNASLQLRVNTANVQADSYVAQITWILSDAP